MIYASTGKVTVPVKNNDIMTLIERIGEHYRTNIGNRYIRAAFRELPLTQQAWSMIESITEKSEYYNLQGYHYDELYERIMALAEFIYHARKEIAPRLRNLLSYGGAVPVGNERILRDMAVNNFGSNLAIMADMVHQLYSMTVDIDINEHKGRTPAYKQIPGLSEIGRYLVPK